MIPKQIHYCWYGPKPLPSLVVKCLKTWREQLYDYKLYLWNEENSPMHIPFVRQAYEAKKYAFVSDYVRFWALYHYGGIYLDTDMFVVKSFDDLIDNTVFFGWETNQETIISCGVIGSIPRHPFMGIVIKNYEKLHFDIESIPFLVVPLIVSKYYFEYLLKKDICVYPYDYFYPFPFEEKENIRKFLQFRTGNTYAIHLWNLSWGTFKDKLRDKIYYHLRKLCRIAK